MGAVLKIWQDATQNRYIEWVGTAITAEYKFYPTKRSPTVVEKGISDHRRPAWYYFGGLLPPCPNYNATPAARGSIA